MIRVKLPETEIESAGAVCWSTQRTVLHEYYKSTSIVLVLVHEETDKEAGEEAVDPLQTRFANSRDGTSEQTTKQSICCKLALQ